MDLLSTNCFVDNSENVLDKFIQEFEVPKDFFQNDVSQDNIIPQDFVFEELDLPEELLQEENFQQEFRQDFTDYPNNFVSKDSEDFFQQEFTNQTNNFVCKVSEDLLQEVNLDFQEIKNQNDFFVFEDLISKDFLQEENNQVLQEFTKQNDLEISKDFLKEEKVLQETSEKVLQNVSKRSGRPKNSLTKDSNFRFFGKFLVEKGTSTYEKYKFMNFLAVRKWRAKKKLTKIRDKTPVFLKCPKCEKFFKNKVGLGTHLGKNISCFDFFKLENFDTFKFKNFKIEKTRKNFAEIKKSF